MASGHDVKGVDAIDGVSCVDFFEHDEEIFDYVFHFATYVEPTVSMKNVKISNPFYDIGLDASLFSWALRTRQKNLIYFSSSSVYPVRYQNDPYFRMKESDVDPSFDTIKKPDNIYGWTKLTGELSIKFLKNHGVNCFVFRPFSIYGRDQSQRFVFRLLLDAVSRRDKVIQVWGDGNQTRDFVHIDDVVEAVLTVVENGHETPMNIGTGIPTSINNMLEIMLDGAMWRPSKIEHLLDKEIGEKHRCADVSMMREVYIPKHSISSIVSDCFQE